MGYPCASSYTIFNGAPKLLCREDGSHGSSSLLKTCHSFTLCLVASNRCLACSPHAHLIIACVLHAGDFVDRGAWGLEVLVLLAALKLAAPGAVTLLRGNHESSTCTQLYGFRTEVARKYGPQVRTPTPLNPPCACMCSY